MRNDRLATTALDLLNDVVLRVAIESHVIKVEHDFGKHDHVVLKVLWQLREKVLRDDEARDVDISTKVVVMNGIRPHAPRRRPKLAEERDCCLRCLSADDKDRGFTARELRFARSKLGGVVACEHRRVVEEAPQHANAIVVLRISVVSLRWRHLHAGGNVELVGKLEAGGTKLAPCARLVGLDKLDHCLGGCRVIREGL